MPHLSGFPIRLACSVVLLTVSSSSAPPDSSGLSAIEETSTLLDALGSPGGQNVDGVDFAAVVGRLRRDRSAEARGALAELLLLGVPDGATGRLEPPGGLTRKSVADTVGEALTGAEMGSGRCFFILGALLEQGEPEAKASVHFRVREDGNVQFLRRGQSPPSLDRTALAYYVGAELGDPLARLAFANYVANGLTFGPTEGEWWSRFDDQDLDHFEPRTLEPPIDEDAALARCQRVHRALVPVAEDAAQNEQSSIDTVADVNFRVETAAEAYRAKKELADWISIHAQDGQTEEQATQANYHLHGDADMNFPRNETRATESFDAAAGKGNIEAVWATLLLQYRSGNVTERFVRILIDSPDTPEVYKVAAQHFAYRYGLGVEANGTRAGVYLMLAADLGDANSQQTVAHGYAGIAVSELDGVDIPGAPNDRRALHYYTLAAAQGRPVSAVNAAALISQRRGGGQHTPLQACSAAASALHDVALAYHPEVLRLRAHARRAFQLGDASGALLRFQLLSELGAKNAHSNAAELWARQGDAPAASTVPCRRLVPGLGSGCESEYLRRAAHEGDVAAMLRLYDSFAVAGDDAAAFHWVKMAEAKGDHRALYTAAVHRQHGLGIASDTVAACEAFCMLYQGSEYEPVTRALALFRVLGLRLAGAECCELPGASNIMVAAAATVFACFATAAVASIWS